MSKNIIPPDKQDEQDFDNQSSNRYDNVLKNVEIEDKESVEVPSDQKKNSNNGENGNDSEEEIRPIMENGEIVGVFHKCICGRETEIRFDYSE